MLLAAGPALAQPMPLLDVAGIPGLAERDHRFAQRFLVLNTPRVLAIGPNGGFGWQAGGGDAAEVERRAMANCQRSSGGAACQVYIRDLSVVAPGRAWAPAEPPPGMRLASFSHETVPDQRMLWWGPEQAAGVVVWAHGRGPGGADSRGLQPQSWVRHLNNAGFDVWRFDRHPNADDALRAAGWLRADLAELRRRGYRRVVVAGQSRGGWNSLMVLDTPGLVDAAIAIAPAAHGDLGSPNHLRQLDDLRAIVAAAQAGSARVAVANFRDDPYDAEPEARGALFRQLGTRAGGFLFLDRPEGLSGHGAGASTAFNERFGACLLRFVSESGTC
jgi:alpha-beta hydrolase superfamily lysophospholipase